MRTANLFKIAFASSFLIGPASRLPDPPRGVACTMTEALHADCSDNPAPWPAWMDKLNPALAERGIWHLTGIKEYDVLKSLYFQQRNLSGNLDIETRYVILRTMRHSQGSALGPFNSNDMGFRFLAKSPGFIECMPSFIAKDFTCDDITLFVMLHEVGHALLSMHRKEPDINLRALVPPTPSQRYKSEAEAEVFMAYAMPYFSPNYEAVIENVIFSRKYDVFFFDDNLHETSDFVKLALEDLRKNGAPTPNDPLDLDAIVARTAKLIDTNPQLHRSDDFLEGMADAAANAKNSEWRGRDLAAPEKRKDFAKQWRDPTKKHSKDYDAGVRHMIDITHDVLSQGDDISNSSPFRYIMLDVEPGKM